MEINHFSHGHPLIQLEVEEHKHHIGDDDGEDIQEIRRCYGCRDPISLSSGAYYYGCVNKCEFFLHKLCAEVPREIDNHPLHPQHKLRLQYRSWLSRCDVCDCEWKEGFVYRCTECYFCIDVICATLMERKFDHKSHIHPLIRLRRPGLFKCDACDTEQKGIFYQCPTCSLFLIHEDCFSLPTTIKCSDHADDHPLTFAYSLPSQYSSFRNYCDICTKYLKKSYWMYYCSTCRFLAHVNCAASKIEPFMSILLPRRASKVTIGEVEDYGKDVIRFPVVDQSVTLISYLLNGVSVTENESTTASSQQVVVPIHEHPLLVVLDHDAQSSKIQLCDLMNDTRVDETICNACVRPIFSTPFYRCANDQFCNFFLHKCCAELPTKIDQHPFHPEHPLILLPKSPNFFNVFKCEGCHLYCNGFSYYCRSCNFYLDVQCGSLPKTIIHEGHHPNHTLSLKENISHRCNACYYTFRGKRVLAYSCNSCDYEIDSRCAVLPYKVRHRYDDHPFVLTYSHVKGHSDDYYCDLCEEKLNPKWWFYHCIDCDQSIHIKCLRPFYSVSNIKYGGRTTLSIESHQHPLALGPVIQSDTKINNSLRVIKHYSECDKCHVYFMNGPNYLYSVRSFGFRCVQCDFKLCYYCARRSR